MGGEHAWHEFQPDLSLTERQLEVLRLKAARRTNAEIAEQLVISITTVKWHVRQVYNKLGANNRAEAIATARLLGLLDQKPDKIEPPSGNLPTPLTPFIGRERELQDLTTALSDPSTRLVTLTGPGGIGKTRLALQAATLNGDLFNDGICWLSFSAQDEAEFVFATVDGYLLATLAATLGLTPQGDEDLGLTLIKYLYDREILIVLDAFENLLVGASSISELLTKTVASKFLVTSRERLNVAGETLYALRGLAHSQQESNEPATSDAVDLFLQAASRISDGKYLGMPEQSTIQRICQRLEGMPLAIELAADWTRLLPIAEIEKELGRGLEFLSSGSSDIRAVIERSWNQLTDGQRTSFARLAIFQRGFSRDAARQVTGTNLRTLATLFDKSLIQRVGADRYTLHDLLRQYAAEQLAASGESEAMGDAHCAFFADLAANQMQALYRGDHSKMLADLDNLRAAWRWAVNHLRLEDVRKMLFPMGWFYDLRAYYPESVAAIRLAVDALHMTDPRGLQGIVYGKALAAYGIRGQRLYGADHGRPYLRQGLEIMRRLGAREDLAWPQILSLFHYGAVADPELQQSYEKYCLDSLATFEELNDPYGVAFSLVVLGSNYRQHGRYAEAQLSIERGLAMSRSLDDREGMAHALRRLGELTLYLGRYDEACENFQEEAARWGELRLPRLKAEALRSLGETYLAREDFERADQALKESLSGFEQVGDQGNALLSLLDLVGLVLTQKQPQIAHRLLQEARSIMDGRQDREEQAQWWLLSGRAYLQQNNLEIAHLVLNRALEYSLQGSRLTLVRTTLGLADLKLHQGDEENAARLTGFAQSHSGIPAALKQQRLKPLQAMLSAALEDDLLAALYGEGAALDAQAIAKMASVEITSI